MSGRAGDAPAARLAAWLGEGAGAQVAVLVPVARAREGAAALARAREALAAWPRELAACIAEVVVLVPGELSAPAFPAAGAGLPALRAVATPAGHGWGGQRKVALEGALARGPRAVLLTSGTLPSAQELAAFCVAGLVEGAPLAVGCRERDAQPGLARACNRVLGLALRDWGSGVIWLAADVLRRVPFALDADDRSFDVELLIQCRALGLEPREVRLEAAAPAPEGSALAWRAAVASALGYRAHQLHLTRHGQYYVDRGVHYTLKHSPTGSHAQILGLIPSGSRVLDVGCSQGLLAKPLRERGARVTGVDQGPPERVSPDLEAYHRRDLEAPLALPEGRVFDRAIVADVIEHLRNRTQLLQSVRLHLKPEGRLVISTPNIALWFYRLSLAVGRFEYGPRGVLDETHVHLFTRASFRRQVELGGFRILRERVTALPFEVVFTATGRSQSVRALAAAYHLLARAWPKLFAYQFVLEAEPRWPLQDERGGAGAPAEGAP